MVSERNPWSSWTWNDQFSHDQNVYRGSHIRPRVDLLEMHDTSFDTIPYTLNISGRLSFFLVIEYNIMITCKCTSHCRLVSLERIFFSQNVIFVKLFDPIRIDNEITLLDIWPAICNILTSDSISIRATFLGLFRVSQNFRKYIAFFESGPNLIIHRTVIFIKIDVQVRFWMVF